MILYTKEDLITGIQVFKIQLKAIFKHNTVNYKLSL